MNVTTINITTVRLSNTESEVNYESDQFANRASRIEDPSIMDRPSVSHIINLRSSIFLPIGRLAFAPLACNDVVVNLSF